MYQIPTTIGPNTQVSPQVPGALLDFLQDCEKYVSLLDEFHQYIIWRYTIGSASVNKWLIFGKFNDDKGASNGRYWTYLFFYYWGKNVGRGGFARFNYFFTHPEEYKNMLDVGKANEIALDVIKSYALLLQRLILKAPIVKKPFEVYKVASPYPGLPTPDANFKPAVVRQQPFNSTTINLHFNYLPFISPGSDCCFFILHIPKGVHVLYVPGVFHAYPIENEILLPFDVSFKIERHFIRNLNYVDPNDVNLQKVQEGPRFNVGPVYDINTYMPCKSGKCNILNKQFNVFEGTLQE